MNIQESSFAAMPANRISANQSAVADQFVNNQALHENSTGIKTAIAYLRFSSDNQRQESIDAQRRSIKDYCKKNNILYLKEYVDAAQSATTDNRPAFQNMIHDIQTGNTVADIVLVLNFSRFSRSRYYSIIYRSILEKHGIQLVSVDEPLPDGPEGSLLEALIEVLNEFYSKNLARNVKYGLKENALKCKHTGGRPPLGFDLDEDKKLKINPYEAKAVQMIFDLYISGYGYGRISDELNNKGYKTKLNQPFGKNSIHDILRNRKYIGEYSWNVASSKDAFGKRNSHKKNPESEIISIPNGCPQIIEPEIFEKVQDMLKANQHNGGRYNAKEYYMLGGMKILKCAKCGAYLTGNRRRSGKSGSMYVSYSCPNRKKHQCDLVEVKADHIHRIIVRAIMLVYYNNKILKRIAKDLQTHQATRSSIESQEYEIIIQALKSLEKKIANTTEAIASAPSPALIDKLCELENSKTLLTEQMTRITPQNQCSSYTVDELRKLKKVFSEYILTTDSPECKKLISELVDQVIVSDDQIEVKLKVKTRSDIELR